MTGDWGPKPPRAMPVKHPPGGAVGTDGLGEAVAHLHSEHPFPTNGENLPHKAAPKIHYNVTGRVYGDK